MTESRSEPASEGFKLYYYDPSFAAAVLFTIGFSVASIRHVHLIFQNRTWYFIPFLAGCLCKRLLFLFRAEVPHLLLTLVCFDCSRNYRICRPSLFFKGNPGLVPDAVHHPEPAHSARTYILCRFYLHGTRAPHSVPRRAELQRRSNTMVDQDLLDWRCLVHLWPRWRYVYMRSDLQHSV